MDFTAQVREKSLDNNGVGVVFQDIPTGTPVGQVLHDHTKITDALDWLHHYVQTECNGVRLKYLYADCDPIWFSTDELKMFLRNVGRWCFCRGVVLHTNSPGLSSQNGQIEGMMSEVMSLTSVQHTFE